MEPRPGIGEWIDIPIFKDTKGGGRRRIGTGDGKVIFVGEKFITVHNGRYAITLRWADFAIPIYEGKGGR